MVSSERERDEYLISNNWMGRFSPKMETFIFSLSSYLIRGLIFFLYPREVNDSNYIEYIYIIYNLDSKFLRDYRGIPNKPLVC